MKLRNHLVLDLHALRRQFGGHGEEVEQADYPEPREQRATAVAFQIFG